MKLRVVALFALLSGTAWVVLRTPRVRFGEAYLDARPTEVALMVEPLEPGRVRVVARLVFPPTVAVARLRLLGDVDGVTATDSLGQPFPPLVVSREAGASRVDVPVRSGVTLLGFSTRVREGSGLGHIGAPLPVFTALRNGPALGEVYVLSLPETKAMGYRCGLARNAYECRPTRARTYELVVPLRPGPAGRLWVFAATLVTGLMATMSSLLGRWSAFFDGLGASAAADDPFAILGFVAGALVSVLGLVGSIGLFAVMADGRLPIRASLAVALWTALAATSIVVSLRTRHGFSALVGLAGLGFVASLASATWLLPALMAAGIATYAQARSAAA